MLKHKFVSELLWFLIAGTIALLVVAPAYISLGTFKHLAPNLLITFGFVTAIRLLFFHKQSPWLSRLWTKGFFIILLIPVILFTALAINEIQTDVDAEGFQFLFSSPNETLAIKWGRYIRSEFVFFGSGLIISCLILPIVLIKAIWSQIKSNPTSTLGKRSLSR